MDYKPVYVADHIERRLYIKDKSINAVIVGMKFGFNDQTPMFRFHIKMKCI